MKKIMIILAAAAFVLPACQTKTDPVPDDQPAVESTISLSEDTVLAGPDGGSFPVTVTSSEDWTVAGYCPWAEVSATTGKSGSSFNVNVEENAEGVTRTATFKVFAGNAVQVLTLISEPTFGTELLTADSFSVNANANSIQVTLDSNAPLSYELPDWITLDNFSTFGSKQIYHFNVLRSQEFKARESAIVFTHSSLEEPIEIAVTQAQRDTAFVAEGTSLVKGIDAFTSTLNIKTNVPSVSYSLPSWLSETVESEETEVDDSGLRTRVISLSATAGNYTRSSTVQFRSGSTTIGSLFVKQQNPNPVYATIPDATLANLLVSNGWLERDEEDRLEVIETGATATSLTVGSATTEISGLEVFPALTAVTVNQNCPKIDLSKCKGITTLTLGTSCRSIAEILFGNDNPISSFGTTSTSHYFTSTKLVISGAKLTSISLSITNANACRNCQLSELDVTGCPALVTLNCRRTSTSATSPLNTIYMTQAQADAVSVTMNPNAQIVIK